MLKVTFLGTGTSQGVPVIACKCDICLSNNPKDSRLRSSILIQSDNTTIVIDTGPDFRYQMLRAKVEQLDAIVYTHGHKDHVAGLDDVRAYNFFMGKPMQIFANEETQEVLRREFEYVFNNRSYPGIPQIDLNTINGQDSFTIGDITITPIKVMHYKMEVLGFRINDFTYITDANYIAENELEKIKGSSTLVLNALRLEKHISHFTLEEAIAIAQQIAPENTYFTHISHQLGLHDAISEQLPVNISLAYDGLTLHL
ncbi:MAG: MBL fold metallo-hydrolase [Flavipsychrobacter sp.]